MISATQNYILYIRRSQDSEDRQICSIEDQEKEMRNLAERLGIQIVEVISESKSAKAPGRQGFNEMIHKIRKGKAGGILTWSLSRLSRNAIDTGTIQWLLQKNTIQCIQTCSRRYLPGDNVLLMAVELGMSNQYILDLKKDISRGMRQKAERGWYPHSYLPIGYIHAPKESRTPEKEIIPHPIYFPIVKKLWKMLLTGEFSLARLHKESKNMGLRNRTGNYLSRSGFHQLFSNEFYCGYFNWDIEGNGKKNRINGKHKKMVTESQFQIAQTIYSKNTRPKIYCEKNQFLFNGIIRCGECNRLISGNRVIQVRCTNPKCRHKFSCKHREDCPHCGLRISEMLNPKIIDHTYYQCSSPRKLCAQKGIKEEDLENQIYSALIKIELRSEFAKWVKSVMQEHERNKKEQEESDMQSWELRNKKLEQTLENYDRMYAMGDMERSRYEKLKNELEKEIKHHQKQKIIDQHIHVRWYDEVCRQIDLASNACKKYKSGHFESKKRIIHELSSNQKLLDKKLYFSTVPTLLAIKKLEKFEKAEKAKIKPERSSKYVENKEEFGSAFEKMSKNPLVWTRVDEIQTRAIQYFRLKYKDNHKSEYHFKEREIFE